MQKAEWHIEVVLCRFLISIITYSFHLTTRAFHTRPCKSTVCVLFRVKYGKGLIRNKHSSAKDYFSTIACTLFYQQSHQKNYCVKKKSILLSLMCFQHVNHSPLPFFRNLQIRMFIIHEKTNIWYYFLFRNSIPLSLSFGVLNLLISPCAFCAITACFISLTFSNRNRLIHIFGRGASFLIDSTKQL